MTETKYYIVVRHKDSTDSWEEEMQDTSFTKRPETNEEAIKFGKDIIAYFNDTLRDGEKPRELVNIKKVTIYRSILDIETNEEVALKDDGNLQHTENITDKAEQWYECQFCGRLGDDEDFSTDVDTDTEPEDMTCEECYDTMNV